MRDTQPGIEPAWLTEELRQGDPAAAISRTALAGTCDLCVQALDLFVALYGAEAGNLAFKVMATDGSYWATIDALWAAQYTGSMAVCTTQLAMGECTMAYNDFTLDTLIEKFDLQIQEDATFLAGFAPLSISNLLRQELGVCPRIRTAAL